MKRKKQFICPCCGRIIRFEDWAAIRQTLIEMGYKVNQSKCCK